MKLVSNWREILTKAWSMRLTLLTALLSGLTIALPMFSLDGLENWLALGTFLSSVGTGIVRVIDQGIEDKRAEADDEPTFV